MSFYDDASLVVIPSGFKTSKVYAEKPTDGSGDLAFTRTGDTASRVNSAGIIEKVRTNYARQSQSFATAAVWSATNGTITNNAGTAPDGTNTASKIVATNTDPFCYQSITLTGPVVASCYVKAVGSAIGKNAEIRAGVSLTTFTLSGNWQRVSVTHTASGAHNYGMEVPNPGVIGDEVLLWGFQVEGGDVVTAYIPTTTAAVSVGPVANVPRLDYLGSTCGKLLLEPQRTNLLQFSEQIDNAYWTKQDASITANTAVSPDGYTNADSLIENSATAQHLVMRTGITITNATAYTASVYFKANTRTRAAIQLAGAGFYDTANGLVIFNLSTGTIVSQSGNATGTITAMGNGWYRCTATKTSVGTSGVVAFNLADSSNNISYAGNGTSGVFLWGAQLETNFATSYIPTLAASVTRGADACSKTGISSLIGQTEGTLYAEANIRANKDSVRALQASDGTTNNRIQLAFIGNDFSPAIVTGGVVQAGITVPFTAGNNKFAIAYANNDVVAYLNGVQVLVDNSATIPTCSVLDVGQSLTANTNTLGDPISQALLFKTRLTNTELATLTTL